MPKMMTCFVMHGIAKAGVMDKPVPRPGPNDAIIRTTAALICTSDTHTVAGAIGERKDLTLGHEAVGVIHELGEVAAASGLFTIGQRVAVNAITPCYACDWLSKPMRRNAWRLEICQRQGWQLCRVLSRQ